MVEAVGLEAPFAALQGGSKIEMVEAVGLEPTSEERVLETSTCVAFGLESRQTG